MTVVATGCALRTALGSSVAELVERLLAGERAHRPNSRFPSETFPCGLAAAIAGEPPPSPHARVLSRLGLFALAAGREAVASAGCAPGPRLGLFSAMGGLRASWDDLMPALAQQEPPFSDSWRRGFRNLHPFWMLQHLSNNAHALLSQETNARGDGVTFSGANAGVQALAAAGRALESGVVDAALVIAYDSWIEPEALLAMGVRRAFTASAEWAAPYDVAANGMVPGEAAAAVVLERAGEAGERAFCSVSAADAADGHATEPDVSTLIGAAERIARGERVVDGCSLARPAFDRAELAALAELLPGPLRLVSLQAATGLLGAATALVQVMALSGMLQRRRLPAIAGLRSPEHGAAVSVGEDTLETSALGLSAAAPGLAGAVRVDITGARRRVT
jgi:3-oxoacyl-(acyl-carrier-protein) synthase